MSIAWGAVLAVGRREARTGWLALVALGLVTGISAGCAFAAVEVARRTVSAHTRLLTTSAQEDARVIAFDAAQAEQIEQLPSVQASWATGILVGKVQGGNLVYVSVTSGPARPPGLLEPALVEGRLPRDDDPDEIVLDDSFLERFGMGVGDTLRLKVLTPEEVFSFDVGFGEPDGPALDLRVVGRIGCPRSARASVRRSPRPRSPSATPTSRPARRCCCACAGDRQASLPSSGSWPGWMRRPPRAQRSSGRCARASPSPPAIPACRPRSARRVSGWGRSPCWPPSPGCSPLGRGSCAKPSQVPTTSAWSGPWG